MSIDNTLLHNTTMAVASMQLLADDLVILADSAAQRPNATYAKKSKKNDFTLVIVLKSGLLNKKDSFNKWQLLGMIIEAVEEQVFMPVRGFDEAARFKWLQKSCIWQAEPEEQPGQVEELDYFVVLEMSTPYDDTSVHQVTYDLCSNQLVTRLQRYKIPTARAQWFLYKKQSPSFVAQ